jgi:hypothetical protein
MCTRSIFPGVHVVQNVTDLTNPVLWQTFQPSPVMPVMCGALHLHGVLLIQYMHRDNSLHLFHDTVWTAHGFFFILYLIERFMRGWIRQRCGRRRLRPVLEVDFMKVCSLPDQTNWSPFINVKIAGSDSNLLPCYYGTWILTLSRRFVWNVYIFSSTYYVWRN